MADKKPTLEELNQERNNLLGRLNQLVMAVAEKNQVEQALVNINIQIAQEAQKADEIKKAVEEKGKKKK